MVSLWMYKVEKGLSDFNGVPDRYKLQVAEVLIANNNSHLVPEEYGGSKPN